MRRPRWAAPDAPNDDYTDLPVAPSTKKSLDAGCATKVGSGYLGMVELHPRDDYRLVNALHARSEMLDFSKMGRYW